MDKWNTAFFCFGAKQDVFDEARKSQDRSPLKRRDFQLVVCVRVYWVNPLILGDMDEI